ncbi:WD40-repeat-containing domain protein [Hyaloraphidium curvatum]|nr:WD40-repeat-containing domain protein [Hyaloraphidium curvatum]
MVDVDVKWAAHQVVLKFLYDQGYEGTAETFLAEAEAVFEDIRKHSHREPPQKPLMAILEDHALSEASNRLNQAALDRKTDTVLDTRGDGVFPDAQFKVLEDVHVNNIIAVRTQTLPSELFPGSAESGKPAFKAVVTGAADKTVRISDAETGRLLTILSDFGGAVLSMDFCPGYPTLLATSSMDGSHQTIDLESQQVVQRWKDHKKYVTRVGFSPDGEFLVSASYDKTCNIYRRDPETGSGKLLPTADGLHDSAAPRFHKVHSITFNGAVESMCFLPSPPLSDANPEGKAYSTVVIGSRDDNYLNYIDLIPEESFPHLRYNVNSNGDDWVSFTPMDLQPSPTGAHVLCFTDQKSGRMIVFRARSAGQAKNIYGTENDGFSQPRCAWSKDGRYIFATSDDFRIWVFEVATGRSVAQLAGHTGIVRDICYDADLTAVVSCSFDKTVRIWTPGAHRPAGLDGLSLNGWQPSSAGDMDMN